MTGPVQVSRREASGRREARRCWRQLYPEKRRAERRRRRHRHREKVFARYGTSCACCGATEDLTIDHVNGDGAEHRAALGNRDIYGWLVVNGFPPGFQTLCGPCNRSKARGPACTIDHHPTQKQDRHDDADAGRSLIAC